MLLRKKYYVNMRVLNSFQHLLVSFLKVLVRVGTKDKPLVKTENSSWVNVCLELIPAFTCFFFKGFGGGGNKG